MATLKTKKVKVTAGNEKHVVYKKTTKTGEGKVGHIMVNHPTKDKGQWDTIDLTAKGRAKTIKQGVAATKKWHKDNPDYKYKGNTMAKTRAQQAATAIAMKKAGKKPKSLPKAQTGGGVIITPKGKIVRGTPEKKTMPGGPRYTVQTLDTAGYSKGKKTFDLTTKPNISMDHAGPIILKKGKPVVKVTKVPRANVNQTISDLKKGSTKTTDLRPKKKK